MGSQRVIEAGLIIVCAILSCLRPGNAFAQTAAEYTVQDLGAIDPTRSYSMGTSLNTSGCVTGWSYDQPTGYHLNAFLWDKSLTPLPLSSSFNSCGLGINSYKDVVGFIQSSPEQAFVYSQGQVYDLNQITNNAPVSLRRAGAINDNRQILAVSANGRTAGARTFLWQNSQVTDVGGLGGGSTFGQGLSSRGEIAGEATVSGTLYHAFYWSNGKLEDLGLVGGQGTISSTARALNSQGTVVGCSFTSTGQQAVRWKKDFAGNWTLKSLDTAHTGQAMGINETGVIVGARSWPTLPWYEMTAFVYDDARGSRNLIDLVGSNSGWTKFSTAYAINAKGQITGTGVNAAGKTHAYLLTPVVPAGRPPKVAYSWVAARKLWSITTIPLGGSATISAGSDVTFIVDSTDPDGDVVTMEYTWLSPQGERAISTLPFRSALQGPGSGTYAWLQLNLFATTPGVFPIQVKMTDNRGNQTKVVTTLTVR